MGDVIRVSGVVGGDDTKVMSLETGKYAGLADGAVMASLGETKILVTATASSQPRDGIDFFPLTVDIEERAYAAGKIPGSFFRREGRASGPPNVRSKVSMISSDSVMKLPSILIAGRRPLGTSFKNAAGLSP